MVPPLASRYRTLAVKDDLAGLVPFFERHVRHSAVIIAEDGGVELIVPVVGGDNRTVRLVSRGEPFRENLRPLRHIVFEAGERTNARSPAAPGFHIATYHGLLLLGKCY